MSGRHVVPEANDLLLLIVYQPPLAASFGGTVLVAGAFFEHAENPTETPTCPAGEVAVTRLATASWPQRSTDVRSEPLGSRPAELRILVRDTSRKKDG